MKKIIALLFSLLLCSCGYYSFSGSALPSHLKTIAIPVFEDRTSEFGVRESLTDALIDEFTKDNTLKIADPRNADSILEGTIISITDRAGAYTDDELASERVKDIKIFITVEVKYRDINKREIIWEESIRQEGTYDPDTDDREVGIDEAVKNLVSIILNKTIAGW